MSKYCRMQNVLIVYELSLLICCCIYVCGEDVELETSTRDTLLVVLGSETEGFRDKCVVKWVDSNCY